MPIIGIYCDSTMLGVLIIDLLFLYFFKTVTLSSFCLGVFALEFLSLLALGVDLSIYNTFLFVNSNSESSRSFLSEIAEIKFSFLDFDFL